MKKKKALHVIGLTGTFSAGKGSVVEILVAHYGAKHFSVREVIELEGFSRGLNIKDRDCLRALGRSLREEHGPNYLVRTIAERIARQKEGFFIIESLRCPGEIDYLSNEFGSRFTLIGVDAPVILRHGRSRLRGTMTDNVDFDDFVRQESLENQGTNPWDQNLFECMDMVAKRFHIWNQWTPRYLRKRTREIAEEIGLKPIRKRKK